jgi:hypothetical protein
VNAPTTTYIGGRMYGDGEYVLEFENVDSRLAPMVAAVISPSGHGYTLGPLYERPSVKLAGALIARVRRDEGR